VLRTGVCDEGDPPAVRRPPGVVGCFRLGGLWELPEDMTAGVCHEQSGAVIRVTLATETYVTPLGRPCGSEVEPFIRFWRRQPDAMRPVDVRETEPLCGASGRANCIRN